MFRTAIVARAGARAFSAAATPAWQTIKTETRGAVGIITLHRPKELNALNAKLISEINAAAQAYDADRAIGAIVLTGSEKAFAAGADIKEMAGQTFPDVYSRNLFAEWADLTKIRKPTIAAVRGFALGGGCELAMMCDIIIAGSSAVFGQPETALGTIPGCGGTQRLVRAVGKAKAMEMVLDASYKMPADEAAAAGLVSRVIRDDAATLDEAVALAGRIARLSKPAVAMAKEAVNAAYEMSLAEGVRFERRLFHSTFATADRRLGMGAFAERGAKALKDLKFTDA